MFDKPGPTGRVTKEKPVLRESPSKFRKERSALRGKMEKPIWADLGSDWEAHHVIPVSDQNHAVFDLMTSKEPGWNHHDPRVNGIALPTTLEGARRSGLPLHQVTEEALVAARPGHVAPGALRDVRFHPNYNRDARDALDKAYELYLADPKKDIEALRRNVFRIRDGLLDRIIFGGEKALLATC